MIKMDEDGAQVCVCLVVIVVVIGGVIAGGIASNYPIEGEIDEKKRDIWGYKFRVGIEWYYCTKAEYEMVQSQDVVEFRNPWYTWKALDLEIIDSNTE